MADKATFTSDEWKVLLESVMMAGIAVTAADPSGLWGTLKESFSSARAMAAGKADTSALVKAVVADFGTSEGRGIAREGLSASLKGKPAAEISAKAVETLGQAAGIVDSKAQEDAAAFKSWLLEISKGVADASSEGGFLGFGGVQVSDAEKATLSQIQAALRL